MTEAIMDLFRQYAERKKQELVEKAADLLGLDDWPRRAQPVTVRITRADGSRREVGLVLRIDTPAEEAIFAGGGLLPHVMRQLLRSAPDGAVSS